MTDQAITFHVEGEPIGKARARVLRNGGAYTPARTAQHETAIKWAAKIAMRGQQPFTGPCRVVVAFDMPIPASWSKRKRALAVAGEIVPKGKPDLDNLAKAVLDSLNKIVLADDAAVVHLDARKRYAMTGKTICTVAPLPAPPQDRASHGPVLNGVHKVRTGC